ncbi:hypothetical protein ACFORG_03905 [Lutimaribacter marinistellae]|uniref:Uncharacterized protein n=1 Tax=Lutimaribacter marinistellae TaxID=1820329 RepID=A0ABV7TBG8_9RHOB
MNKTAIIGILAVAAIGIAIFALTRPEPTPQERLSDAVGEASGAVEDAVKALGDAANEARDAAADELQAATTELQDSAINMAATVMEQVNSSAQETKEELRRLMEEWKSSGVVTEEGINFDNALATVEASNLSARSKDLITELLSSLQSLPAEATAKLAELEAALGN